MVAILLLMFQTPLDVNQLAKLIENSTQDLVAQGEQYEHTQVTFESKGKDHVMTLIQSYITPGTTSNMQERRQVHMSTITQVSLHGVTGGLERTAFVLIKYRPDEDGAFKYKGENQQQFGTVTAFRLGTYTPSDAQSIVTGLQQLVLATQK